MFFHGSKVSLLKDVTYGFGESFAVLGGVIFGRTTLSTVIIAITVCQAAVWPVMIVIVFTGGSVVGSVIEGVVSPKDVERRVCLTCLLSLSKVSRIGGIESLLAGVEVILWIVLLNHVRNEVGTVDSFCGVMFHKVNSSGITS